MGCPKKAFKILRIRTVDNYEGERGAHIRTQIKICRGICPLWFNAWLATTQGSNHLLHHLNTFANWNRVRTTEGPPQPNDSADMLRRLFATHLVPPQQLKNYVWTRWQWRHPGRLLMAGRRVSTSNLSENRPSKRWDDTLTFSYNAIPPCGCTNDASLPFISERSSSPPTTTQGLPGNFKADPKSRVLNQKTPG